ncbi:MAG: polyprenyl synthetase family protein [Anaerolineales bacterium]
MDEEFPITSQMLKAASADLRRFAGLLQDGSSKELYEMTAHHFGWDEDGRSGKGVRPLLCLLSCAAAGGDWERAVPAATGIELIHNFSLIHDDIEDGSDLRRHRPTLWKIWGMPQAVNAGDALFALARLSGYRLLEHGHDRSTILEILQLLDETCLDLTKGQYLDLGFDLEKPQILDRYLEMIRNKTASLVASSAAVGALCAGAADPIVSAYRAFGHHLGLAFQILDDVLGIWGSEGSMGKPVGEDVATRKPSYPPMYALDNSQEFEHLWRDSEASNEQIMAALDRSGAQSAAHGAAAEQTRLAFENLATASPTEPAASALRGLADRLLVRES